MGAAETGPVQLVEEYGPAWSPGPFERGTDGPRVILVGVDGSATSLRAGAYAAGLARRQRSRLVVVFVIGASGWNAMAPGLAGVREQAIQAQVEDLRRQIRERAGEIGVPITLMVRRGDAFGELRDAATDLHADMVVVGASEQAGHRLVGSVATRLVRAGRWPVTVVP